MPADLSREDGCLRLAGEVTEREDSLDILVDDAGVTWGEPSPRRREVDRPG